MSLTDELLADLGSDSESEFEKEVSDEEQELNSLKNGDDNGPLAGNGTAIAQQAGTSEQLEANATDEAIAILQRSRGLKDLPSVVKLVSQLLPELQKIESFIASPKLTLDGDVESNPEYQLILESNALTVRIDTEQAVLDDFIRKNYKPRFPELETLILNPVDYAKAVKVIQNNVSEVPHMGEKLREFLAGSIVMVVTMSAFQSQGRDLPYDTLVNVLLACDTLLSLYEIRSRILSYVASRLHIFAPNITAIVGSHTAAQLVGVSGGMMNLAKTPACNLPSIGVKREINTGESRSNVNEGFIYYCDLVQKMPPKYRRQAMRIISAKLVLAARIDLSKPKNGNLGEKFRAEIEKKLENLLTPPENKGDKALPVPIDKPSKKRGGRRARKFKEQFGMSELRKAANRVKMDAVQESRDIGYLASYSVDDDDDVDVVDSGGLSNRGVRGAAIDTRTKGKVSKNMQARLANNGNANFNSSTNSKVAKTLMDLTPVPAVSFGEDIQFSEPTSTQRSGQQQSSAKPSVFSTGRFVNVKRESSPSQIPAKRSADSADSDSKRIKELTSEK